MTEVIYRFDLRYYGYIIACEARIKGHPMVKDRFIRIGLNFVNSCRASSNAVYLDILDIPDTLKAMMEQTVSFEVDRLIEFLDTLKRPFFIDQIPFKSKIGMWFFKLVFCREKEVV